MTRQSRILDRIIKGKYQLEVRALSADMKKPLTLHAVLTDYDEDGFLYRGRSIGDFEEGDFYLTRSVVVYMRFSQEEMVRSDDEKSNVYFFGGVEYDSERRELIGNGCREFVIGHNYHRLVRLLFENTESPVDTRILAGLQSEDAPTVAAGRVRTPICHLRKVLNKFGLTIFSVMNRGYILKELKNNRAIT